MHDPAISKFGTIMVFATLILNAAGMAGVYYFSTKSQPTQIAMEEESVPTPEPVVQQPATQSADSITQELVAIKEELAKIRADQRALNIVLGSSNVPVSVSELMGDLVTPTPTKKP